MLPPDGKTWKNVSGSRSSSLARAKRRSLDFRLPSLKPGTRQGVVRILGQDSLAADDVRYFTDRSPAALAGADRRAAAGFGVGRF